MIGLAHDRYVLNPDDERVARLLRLLRTEAGLTQQELARNAVVPRTDVIAVEAGSAGAVALDRLRRMFEAVGGRGRFGVWWNGAVADRLLDERHAVYVERTVALYRRRLWEPAVEVSFADYGERGSIDVLAAREAYRAVAITEVKSDIGSLEEMNRVLDVKERLAPKIAETRFGWRPVIVGRILVLPATTKMRTIVDRHAATMRAIYPARTQDVKAWLHTPIEPIRGIWFISEVAHRDRASR